MLACSLQKCVCSQLAMRYPRRYSPTATAATAAVDHLVLTVDGFNAAKATQVYPELQQLQVDAVQPSLDVVQQVLPQRILGTTLTNHPQLLSVDLTAWVDFLTVFGFDESNMQELMRSCPEVFYNSNIFQAGQLLLFLRQHLHLPDQDLVRYFKWAAVLQPGATKESMVAITHALQQHLAAHADDSTSSCSSNSNSNSSSSSSTTTCEEVGVELLPLLQMFPEVLGWDVDADLLPKLQFFDGLGSPGKRLLRGTLWEPGSGWLPGLRSWSYSVIPKLQLLADVLGSEQEARQLVLQAPTILKLPVETKLQPVMSALTALGLNGDQVAQLLRACPKLLAENKDDLVSRVNFLLDVIGGSPPDLLMYPEYVLLSLSDTIGPRYYFLARHPGWLDTWSDPVTGGLQLRRVMQPPLDTFLQDVAQVTGAPLGQVTAEYKVLAAEWDNLLGWCCDKAFSSLDRVDSMYQEQINLFYVLVQ